jgi:hypothetical protein
MIEDDRRSRKSGREIGQLRDLRVIDPGIEREPILPQSREPLTELRVEQQSFRKVHRR